MPDKEHSVPADDGEPKGEPGGKMDDLSKVRIRQLVADNAWSVARAGGYLDGESFRRRGTTPSKYAQIGIDDYCLGFRAGYYVRTRTDKPVLLIGAPGNLDRDTASSNGSTVELQAIEKWHYASQSS